MAGRRIGVWLSPKQIAIFDAIVAAGNAGLCPEAIGMSRNLAKQYIYQINSRLEETNWIIRGRYGSHNSDWRLTRRYVKEL